MNARARTLRTSATGAAIAILAIVAPGPGLVAVARAATPASACTATAGVIVIVDLTHFGRNVERGCASGRPATALAALQAAGFATAGTANYGDAFVCRIDGLPLSKVESCRATPPAKSSWSFYSAHRADTAWTYSSSGVLSVQPAPGTIIAFAFGNYAKPSVRPSEVISPPSTTTTTTPVATTSPPAIVQATLPPSTTPPSTTTLSNSAPFNSAPFNSAPFNSAPFNSGSSTSVPPTTVPDSTTPAATTTTSNAPRVVDRAASGGRTHDDSGSPLPALLTVVLLAVLGVGAAVTIRARRRRPA